MFDGFRTGRFSTPDQVDIFYRIGGSGPPLLLLHGYPQTHAMWHLVAPGLAERFTVVCPDLRGYGDSAKPAGGPDHSGYSKRAMAADQVALMSHLGFHQFRVAGHDRGARVTHRMALDHPDAVERAAVLDIVPTRTVFEAINQRMAMAYYHWFFLSQPDGLPERMIGADPDFYLLRKLQSWSRIPDAFTPMAVAEYLRCFREPDCIHATCEDYRAGAGIDLIHDAADFGRNRVQCPMLVLWGGRGIVGGAYDVLAVWRDYADDVQGRSIDCGHFLPEEAPAETLSALAEFF